MARKYAIEGWELDCLEIEDDEAEDFNLDEWV